MGKYSLGLKPLVRFLFLMWFVDLGKANQNSDNEGVLLLSFVCVPNRCGSRKEMRNSSIDGVQFLYTRKRRSGVTVLMVPCFFGSRNKKRHAVSTTVMMGCCFNRPEETCYNCALYKCTKDSK